MSNQLVGSIVRGFGFTLGRKAANAVTKPNTVKMSKVQKKQLELIAEFEKGINNYTNTLNKATEYRQNGKITEREYQILEKQCLDGISECEFEINKLKNIEPKSGVTFGKVVMWILLIPIILGIIGAIFG